MMLTMKLVTGGGHTRHFLLGKSLSILEVTVTSTWHNRLAYDAKQPPERRKTWTDVWSKASLPLVPYGLLGPACCLLLPR